MTEAMHYMQAEADSIEAKLLVLLFPFKEQVYRDIAEQFQPRSQHFSREQIEAPMAAVKSLCDEAGILCCDLTGPLRDQAARKGDNSISTWVRTGARKATRLRP